MVSKHKSFKDDDLQSWLDQELDNYAEELKDAMQGTVHVVTGNLRDSITVEKKKAHRTVGVDADRVKRKTGEDYSIPYYYEYARGEPNGHKFLEEAMNKVR